MSVLSEIQSVFDRFIAAWNRNDARGCADEFAADGSLINPFGQEARGSEAIAGLYAEYFATMLKGTTTTFTSSSVRELGSLALVDGTQTIDNLRAPVRVHDHPAGLTTRAQNYRCRLIVGDRRG